MDQPYVLFLANRFQLRGSSLYTLRLAGELQARGWEINVVSPDATAVSPALRGDIEIHSVPHLRVPVWSQIVRRLLVRRILADERGLPDLIHIQARSMLPLGAWLARTLHRPFLLTVHDYLSPRERFPFDGIWGKRIIAISESVRESLIEQTSVAPDLVSVIHTGVSSASLSQTPTSEVLDAGHEPVVGAAAALEEGKGMPFFLGAADKVLDTHKHAQFLLAGAGPEEANLRRLARELKITDHLTFATNLQEFTAALSAMDIFCLPALSQGLGTVMLEAMALGKPVIATGVGGIFSVIHDHETGLVVPPADSSALARKIIELLDNPRRARAIGENGRSLVLDKFNIENTTDATVAEYERLLAHQPARVA